MEVKCKAGWKVIKAYGETKSNGKYSITVKDFDYVKYGPTVCKAKLFAPPKDSPFSIPTKLNEGTTLKVKSKDKYEVVLKAKPFAYASKKHFKECEKPSPTPYYYKSPPPPTPVYKYNSPPPPSPKPTPPYYYKSPPPPSPSPPPPYLSLIHI